MMATNIVGVGAGAISMSNILTIIDIFPIMI